MNSKNKDIKTFIDELENWIESTDKDKDIPYVLNMEKYKNFKITFSYFRKLVEKLEGNFVYIDCQPESFKATLSLTIPELSMYKEEIEEFIGVINLYDFYKITPSGAKGLLLEVYINDMWHFVTQNDGRIAVT